MLSDALLLMETLQAIRQIIFNAQLMLPFHVNLVSQESFLHSKTSWYFLTLSVAQDRLMQFNLTYKKHFTQYHIESCLRDDDYLANMLSDLVIIILDIQVFRIY